MNEQPIHLDLFSGIGGFALAAGWAGFRTIGFCEIEPYAQAVLKKHWPQVPIHNDIRELRGGGQRIDLLTGGFPCQPFSVAGKRRGKDDDRHLWPQMLRIIEESKPSWIIGENVAGIIPMELDKVCADLEAVGYEVQPLVIPACAVDAPHRRDRVWILAHARNICWRRGFANGFGGNGERKNEKKVRATATTQASGSGKESETVADSESSQSRQQTKRQGREDTRRGGEDCGGVEDSRREAVVERSGEAIWLPESGICRVSHGVRNRVDRIKGLGNAIVPQVAYQIIKGIKEVMEQSDEN